jgi:hypothetical protein
MTAASPLNDEPSAWMRDLQAYVRETAPKVFAVVGEWECEDGLPDAGVLAWGLEHSDGRATVVGEDGGFFMPLLSPHPALTWFERFNDGTVRLMWPSSA